jgi:hypothetical protein
MRSIPALLSAALLVAMSSAQIRAHDIYSHLKDKGGAPCCNEKDCRPAPFKVIARGVQMLVAGKWINIPADMLQYRSLAGDTGVSGGGHWCGSTDWGYDGVGFPDLYGVTRCAILPPNFSLATFGLVH